MKNKNKNIGISVNVDLGNLAKNWFYKSNKGDLIFRIPFAIYITGKVFFTMINWSLLNNSKSDPIYEEDFDDN